MRVIAVPTSSFPPAAAELAAADVVIEALGDITEDVIDPTGDKVL